MPITQVGFVGLGRMGGNMVKVACQRGGIDVVVWNRTQSKVEQAVEYGAKGAPTIPDLISALQTPRVVWLMLPSGDVTQQTFEQILDLLDKDDIIIEGANSHFHDTVARHKQAESKGIKMLDVGVSGGILAANSGGYPMMIGGQKETYEFCKPLFDAIGLPGSYGLVGPGGAGHYVKMVHNAIEYGMMQAIAEGFDLMERGTFAGTLNPVDISKIWSKGCIVSGLLMDITRTALERDTSLNTIAPHVADSGEGRWSAQEALDHDIPFVVNTYALHARYTSRDERGYAFRMLAAMRNVFGGHAIKKSEEQNDQ